MDPYIIIKIGKKEKTEFTTKIANGKGKTPVWDCKFNYELGSEREFQFGVYDRDILQNQILGMGFVNLENFLERNDFSEWFSVFNEGEETGKVLFEIEVMNNI